VCRVRWTFLKVSSCATHATNTIYERTYKAEYPYTTLRYCHFRKHRIHLVLSNELETRTRSKHNTMRFTVATITALVAPLVAQSVTPAPTTTDDWYGAGAPWASSNSGKWSSVYNSLVSDGKTPSTLTAAPWPTGSYGPGQGPWGPGGHGGPGGGHWGGTLFPV
jgi:hypothetical protein